MRAFLTLVMKPFQVPSLPKWGVAVEHRDFSIRFYGGKRQYSHSEEMREILEFSIFMIISRPRFQLWRANKFMLLKLKQRKSYFYARPSQLLGEAGSKAILRSKRCKEGQKERLYSMGKGKDEKRGAKNVTGLNQRCSLLPQLLSSLSQDNGRRKPMGLLLQRRK